MRKRIVSILTAISIVFGLAVFSAEEDVNAAGYNGEFDLSRQTVSITNNGRYRVYGRSNGSNRIEVAENLNNVYIAFDSVNIQLGGGNNAPFKVGRNSVVTAEIMGNNILTSTGKAPAIEVNKNEFECGELIIRGDGALEATGGKYCPAIGGNSENDAGKIEIQDGLINAVGGDKAAAIGGSYKHGAFDIKIYGGTITAEAKLGGAGIGGGFEGDVTDLFISGGKITAKTDGSGAGIGGGYRGNGGNLQIYGGDITAITDEYAFGIGSGRYAAGTQITISGSPSVLAFASRNTDAIEYDGIVSNSMAAVVTGTFSTDYFEEEQRIEVSGEGLSKTAVMPEGTGVMSFLAPKLGSYTVSANGVPLFCSNTTSVTNSNQKEILEVKDAHTTFTLRPSCACEQTDITFNIADVKFTSKKSESNVTKNTTKTITLSATGGTLKRWSGCPKHTGSTNATYEYYIVSDPAKIAEIDGKKLKITAKIDGVYTVVVGVKATVQDLVKTAQTSFTVTKTLQTDALSIDDSSITISKNGIYTITGSTLRNTIKVDPGLDDVTVILQNVTINLDGYDGTKASPIEIGEGSNVTLNIPSGTSRITSNDKGVPIHLKDGTSSTPTVLTVTGSGKLYATTKNSGACIGSSAANGGNNTKIYILDGSINTVTDEGYCIGGNGAEVFISEDVEIMAANAVQGTAPILGKIITDKYQTYNPAILVQGLLEKPLEKQGDIIFKEKEFLYDDYDSNGNKKSTTKIKNVTVNDIPKKSTGFAAILKEMGSYTASLDTGASSDRTLYEGTAKESGEDYYVVDEYSEIFKMHYEECKCSISAPKAKVATITIPYDKQAKSVKIEASGGVVKSSDECSIHTNGREGAYSFSIVEDEDDVFSVSGSTLTASASKPGKYKAKIRVRVSSDGLTAEKEISVSAEKLSKEDMEKKLGKEHLPYLEGDESGNFRPDDFITRAEVTAMLSKIDEGFATAQIMLADFSDVKKSDWYSKFVSYMSMQNMVTGYEDGSFKPDEYMTRAEFAAIACRKAGLEPKTAKNAFKDIEGHWANSYICSMSKKKYITGYEDKNFRPDNLITRAEATVIINRLLDREPKSELVNAYNANSPFPDVKSSHWAYYDILEATLTHFGKEFH